MSRNGFPGITLKWSQTLDGQLADDLDQSQWISGPEERRYTHRLRSEHQGVLVGAQTFLKDRCQLTVREPAFRGIQPVRVIMDPRGRIFEAVRQDENLSELLEAGPRRTYLLTDVMDDGGVFSSTDRVVHVTRRFEDMTTWLTGILSQFVAKFEILESRKFSRLMVEGGAGTLTAFLQANLADQIEVSVSPLILGGKKHRVAPGLFLRNSPRFEVQSQESLGVDVLLRYKVSSFEGVSR